MDLTDIYNSRDYITGETWAEYCHRKGISALEVVDACKLASKLPRWDMENAGREGEDAVLVTSASPKP